MGENQHRYGLTATEWEIMDAIWDSQTGMTFPELLDYLNGVLDKQWQKTTLRTYLNGLQKMGLLESRGRRKAVTYCPLCTRDAFIHRWTKRLVEKSYENSLEKFVIAFTGGAKLTAEEVASLQNLLDEVLPPEPEEQHKK